MKRVTKVKPGSPRTTRISGFAIILIATATSGVAAYVMAWLVPNVIGLASYATFAVFWSAIHLVVGALFGIQQEVTRGTHPLTDPSSTTEHAMPGSLSKTSNTTRRTDSSSLNAGITTSVRSSEATIGGIVPNGGRDYFVRR
jgi:predicted membrane-bound mannosyltransferase